MTAVLLDTHAWAWSLTDDPRLSRATREAIGAADAVQVSPVSFFEIGQKVRLGKWPEMAGLVGHLPAMLAHQGGSVATLDPGICLAAGTMVWDHRDPFDRLLAATAAQSGMPLISADVVFDGIVWRIW